MDANDIIRIKEAEKDDVVTKGALTLFWGGWASQWYPSTFILDDSIFNCAEQWMMYSKAKFFKDDATAKKVLEAKWPRTQKELGRKVRGYVDAFWDEPVASRAIVLRGNMAKFGQNADLRELLLRTGYTHIAEASTYDAKWGIGLGMNAEAAWAGPEFWKGQNWLGHVLMQTRDLLRDQAVAMHI